MSDAPHVFVLCVCILRAVERFLCGIFAYILFSCCDGRISGQTMQTSGEELFMFASCPCGSPVGSCTDLTSGPSWFKTESVVFFRGTFLFSAPTFIFLKLSKQNQLTESDSLVLISLQLPAVKLFLKQHFILFPCFLVRRHTLFLTEMFHRPEVRACFQAV